jgi:hypothetical protein
MFNASSIPVCLHTLKEDLTCDWDSEDDKLTRNAATAMPAPIANVEAILLCFVMQRESGGDDTARKKFGHEGCRPCHV